MKDRVKAILERYEAMFGGADTATDNAMMLALAIDRRSRRDCRRALRPRVEGRNQRSPVQRLRPQDQGKLEEEARGSERTRPRRPSPPPRGLGSGDPISLYMHEEMRLEHAASEVDRMAHLANVKPVEMFTRPSRRYQAQLASYTLEDLVEREDKGPAASQGAYL